MSKKGSKKSPFLIYKKRGEDYLLREKIEGVGEYIVISPEEVFGGEYPVLTLLEGELKHIEVTEVNVQPSRDGISVILARGKIAVVVDHILKTFIAIKNKEETNNGKEN